MTPPVWFYIPEDKWPPGELPTTPEGYWDYAVEHGLEYTSGRYITTVRTWLELQAIGFECGLTKTVPPDGIVVTHVDFLPHTPGEEPWDRQPVYADWLRETFVVCFQADRPRYPYANLLLVQNGNDKNRDDWTARIRGLGVPVSYMPYWTQRGLLTRDESRGEEFTNVAFFGHPGEIDPALKDPAWLDRMRAEGFEVRVQETRSWHDYHDVDCVLAIRDFSYKGKWLWKPPTKLFNAWLAGVPAVLGHESAFLAERHSRLDYLEVRSRADVEDALRLLRDDLPFRQAMVRHGWERVPEIDARGFAHRWKRLLETEAYPAYEEWQRLSSRNRALAKRRNVLRTKTETTLQTIAMARHLSRDVYAHSKDWN